MSEQTRANPTMVVVHGAFADESGWNGVIERLEQQGCTVVVPANRLRGVAADSAHLASVVSEIDGPELLAGHSYGGALITSAATSASIRPGPTERQRTSSLSTLRSSRALWPPTCPHRRR